MNTIKNIFYLTFPLILGITINILLPSYNYQELIKPPLSPPGIIFQVVWTILYILMGISYFLYKNNNNTEKIVDIIYYLQLSVNITWTIIFFTLKLRFLAIIWTLTLVILVYTLITLYLQKNKISGYLQIPYLIWCIFATYLTIGIYLLN